MTETAPAKPAVTLQSPDCDLLTGVAQIAEWYGLSAGQSNARIRSGDIAVFKLPGKSNAYCLKSENTRRWNAAAEAYRNRSNGLT